MIAGIIQGIAIGLGAAVPIGQVNVEIARRTLRGGFWPGFAVGAGACSVDVTYAVLTTIGVGTVLARPNVSHALAWVAVVVLVYLGVQCLRAGFGKQPTVVDDATAAPSYVDLKEPRTKGTPAASGLPAEPPDSGGTLRARLAGARAGYATGLAMTSVNPMTIAFWFLTLPGIAGPVSRAALLPIAAGVAVGTFSWVVTYAGILSVVRRFRPGGWMRIADIAGGLTLLGFAVRTVVRAVWG
jgi:threonine/homoserine/homoserine lactone efflux protein